MQLVRWTDLPLTSVHGRWPALASSVAQHAHDQEDDDAEPPGPCAVCGQAISDWSMADGSGAPWGLAPKHLSCAYRPEPSGLPKYRAPVRPSHSRSPRRPR